MKSLCAVPYNSGSCPKKTKDVTTYNNDCGALDGQACTGYYKGIDLPMLGQKVECTDVEESGEPLDSPYPPITFDCSCITNGRSVIRDTFPIELIDWSYIPDHSEMEEICTQDCIMMSEDWPDFDEIEEDIKGSVPTVPTA